MSAREHLGGAMVVVVWSIVCAMAVAGLVAAHRAFASARDDAVDGLVRALALKDAYTGEHTERVARYSRWIGEELGWRRHRLARLEQAARLHDIGKLAVPTTVLNKPGGLTEPEFRQVERHAHVCEDILGVVDALRPFVAAAAGHHRRFDGHGYGRGEQSRQAAVVAVADAYDAMTSTRPYRRALPQAVAFEELRRRAGTQFDPACVDALLAAIGRRGVTHGLGHEEGTVVFAVEPPVVGPVERIVLTGSTHRVRW